MFLVSKIITSFILPPGLILVCLIPLFFVLRKSKRGGIYFYIVFTAIYLFSINPIANSLLTPLEEYSGTLSLEDRNSPELVIVLGGGSILQKGENRINSVTRERIMEGIFLSRELKIPLHFTGGNVLKGKGAPGEAAGASEYIRRYDEDFVFSIEGSSRNTFENAVFSAEQHPGKRIVLVTSAFHMKRSIACFRKAGFDISYAVAVDFRIDEKERNITDFLPSGRAFENSSTALKEYWGLLYYKLRGFI